MSNSSFEHNKEQTDEDIIETIISTRNRQMKTLLKPLYQQGTDR